MASYHFTVKPLSMASKSAVHRAAYQARTQLYDERNGKWTKDYSDRGDLAWSGMFAPTKDRPDWTHDRQAAWNRAEKAERQANGRPCRDFELAIPNELTREQQIRLATDFVRERFVRQGRFVDANLHSDYDKDGKLRPGADPNEPRNDHLHLLVSERMIDGQEFARTKTGTRDFNSKEQLEQWREQWAKAGARALRRAGFEQEAARFEVGHLTLPEQRQAAIERGDRTWAEQLDREPDMKQGAKISQMEKRGQRTERGDERRAIQQRNADRKALQAEAKVIDLQIERLKRQERQGQQQRQAEPGRGREREIDRAQDRFEQRANANRAAQQNRRLEETGDQQRRHAAERLDLEGQQEQIYGAQLKALGKEAAAIAERQQQAKGWRGLASRVTGQQARDRDRMAGIEASRASIEQRKTEQAQALAARQTGETSQLAARHAEQDRQLERRIETERAGEGWIAPDVRREATTGRAVEVDRRGIDAEAENLAVGGPENSAGETAAEQEQAPTAPPEAAQQGQETEAERNARIDAEQAWQEARAREYGQDYGHDPGREMSR